MEEGLKKFNENFKLKLNLKENFKKKFTKKKTVIIKDDESIESIQKQKSMRTNL